MSVKLEVFTTLRRRMLLFSRASVTRLCPEHDLLLGAPIRDQGGLVATLFDVVDLLHARLAGLQQGIRQTAASLLLQLVGELSPIPVLTDLGHPQLLSRILQYIEENLSSPTLTPAGIATAHAISLRTLCGLFGQYHSPVAGYIHLLCSRQKNRE